MHPLLILAAWAVVSCVVAVLIARAIPPAGRDPVLRDLREDHAQSDTVA